MLYYKEKKSNKKHYLRVLSLLLLITISLINPKANEYTSRVVNFITTPFSEFTVLVKNSINSLVDFSIGTKPNREMVKALTAENQELLEKINKLELIVNQHEHLMKEYEFSKNIDAIDANIVMQNNDYFFKKIVINKGKIHGVELGDIVLNSYSNESLNVKGALVGKVIEVNDTSSIVSTILDETYNITFMHSVSSYTGIINERVDNSLNGYMLKKTEVKIGDKIYTSGTGGRFERGIFIGEVFESFESEDRLRQIVKIKSPVDFARLYNVYIIKGENNYE